jgi:hypothetical protein
MKSRFKRVAYRSPETGHCWRLLQSFCDGNDYEVHDLKHNFEILSTVYTLAEKDAIWMFHKRVGPDHFEMIIAPKKYKTLPI